MGGKKVVDSHSPIVIKKLHLDKSYDWTKARKKLRWDDLVIILQETLSA